MTSLIPIVFENHLLRVSRYLKDSKSVFAVFNNGFHTFGDDL